MKNKFKRQAALTIQKAAEYVAKTTVNKSILIAAYEPEIPSSVKTYCESQKQK